MGFLCVSVDLDEIDCYHAIHGLKDAPQRDAARAVYRRALPRIARFFEDNELKGTLFVVGKDLAPLENSAGIAMLFRAGNEIANHTASHLYNFTLLTADEQTREIESAGAEIARVTGVRPRGFRAPGYNMNMGVVSLLEKQGYDYDSSIFACPAYYAAKAAAIGMKQMAGRTSKSVLGDPRVLTAPNTPYRIGEEGVWSRADNGLKELPITTVTKAKLPFIGTAVAAAGVFGARMLAKGALSLPVVNFELHGMDFLDADLDDLVYLTPHQSDLRIPLKKRTAAIEAAVKTLLDKGLAPLPLCAAAERVFL